MKTPRCITVRQMRKLDQTAIRKYHIPGLLLMENAGRSTAEILIKDFRRFRKPPAFLVVCGRGNNGGDGFVIARHLDNQDYPVRLLLIGDEAKIKGDVRINWRIVQTLRIPCLHIRKNESIRKKVMAWIQESDVVVDALFGVGVNREVTGTAREFIQFLNNSGKPIYAVDVPSGLHADTGQVLGVAVRARKTITMGAIKKGLLHPVAKPFVGKLALADISLPRPLRV